MTVNQLIELFANSGNKVSLEMSDILKIGKFVNIEAKMDKLTLDYFYSISILDIVNSKITDDLIYEMMNKGWTLNKSKNSIIKYA